MRILVALCLIAPAALADPPKYTRKPKLELEVRLSDRVKPIAKSDRPVPVRPDDILVREEHAEPLREQQEAVLEKLVRDTPDDDPDKPDYLFRLAEHYAGQMRLWHIRAVELELKETAASPRRRGSTQF